MKHGCVSTTSTVRSCRLQRFFPDGSTQEGTKGDEGGLRLGMAAPEKKAQRSVFLSSTQALGGRMDSIAER